MSEEIENEVIDIADDIQDDKPAKIIDENLRGFMSREEWVASGKDADDWRSPREFRERGELIQRIAAIEKQKDSEIKNLNMLHEIRLKNEREELMQLRDNAIDVADKAEVKRIDARIKDNERQADLIKEPDPVKTATPKEVVEFMDEHPWAKDTTDARTVYANKIIENAMAVEGKTLASALRLAEKAVQEKFSDPQKKTEPKVESSRTAGKVSTAGTITWSQLTPAEEKCYIPGMWKNEAEFLKAVANDRKGSK